MKTAVKAKRRFTERSKKHKPMSLSADHKAVVNGVTLFPTQVRVPDHESNLFKPGANNVKIGSHVAKGKLWAGFPIYMLSLEERATCPRVCENWNQCLLPGSLVLTANLRWVPIEKLKVGDKIVGFDEEHDGSRRKLRRFRTSIVEALGEARKASYRVSTSLGELSASAEHLWLVRRDRAGFMWRKTEDLELDDEIQFLKKPWFQNESYEAGRVRGFVEGEGFVDVRKGRLGWAQRPGKLIEEINHDVKKLGFHFISQFCRSGVNRSEMHLTHLEGGWREVMRFLGTIRPTRLIERAEELFNGRFVQAADYGTAAKVRSIEPLGRRKVITIKTSTKTLVAEGFLVHNCYGNHMPFARRWAAGEALEQAIPVELTKLAKKHPGGFVVRLHILGDFYSAKYVKLWGSMMARIPQLCVYGYTRREKDSAEGIHLRMIEDLHPGRWRIRWSERPGEMGTKVTDDVTARGKTPEGIVCPAQTEGDEVCCGNCSLCWSQSAPIIFINH